jgi:spermidine synthase
MALLLFISILLIAACGLVYELIAGALASYLLGDSITQFSIVIGSYLFAMGIGSFLSRYIRRAPVARFIWIELMVAIFGGFSSTVLFLVFAYTQGFRVMLYFFVITIGVLVGLEIPLLMRILKNRFVFRDVVAHVLTFDYLGALGASLLFPLVLVPELGLVRSAILFGIINALVALWSTHLFRDQVHTLHRLRIACFVVLALLLGGMFTAKHVIAAADESLYADEVVFAKDTRYQRIVLTQWKDDTRLFLNSHLQFSSRDEYRYHEALVHPGLAAVVAPKHVLVLGGGDGLAVREILRYSSVERITLVDLDREMTSLFRNNALLTRLNEGSLHSPKLHVINEDAYPWLEKSSDTFDFVIIDFPDPTNYSLGKLYSSGFYRLLAHRISRTGMLVVQATSPMFARQSYWCVVQTLQEAGFKTYPYHAYVPSFGEWGFVLAGAPEIAYRYPDHLPSGLRFLTVAALPELFAFPPDMQRVPVEPNRLNDQVLVRYYDKEWREISH